MQRKGRNSNSFAFWVRPLLFLSVVALAAATGFSASAQQGILPSLTPEQIQALQQAQQSNQRLPGEAAQPAPDIVLQPDQPRSQPQLPLPQSRLERLLSRRAGATLTQFGYDQLGSARSVTVPQTGAVQDDYILGTGDELTVILRGQENSELRVLVDRNGQVALPRLSPISATGRSLGSFRSDVSAAIARAYVASNAFVSVSRVRQISVLVSGEVNNPGLRLVTGLSSVVDALLLSGGVKKTGALRNIRIQRGTHEYVVDLYSVLTAGAGSMPMRLADGDRIRVPLLGATAAITGLVRQPAIYELPSGQDSISVRALMALAGGEEVRGLFRLSVLRTEADGRANLVALQGDTAVIRDSEILFVQFGADQVVNRATLTGDTGMAGMFPVTQATKLSDMLKAPGVLGANPYMLFGLISRRDPVTQMRSLVPFTPVAVLRGTEVMALQNFDIVHVISADEYRMLMSTLEDFNARKDAERQAIRNPVATTNISAPPAGGAPAGGVTASGVTAGGALASAVQGNANTLQQAAREDRGDIKNLGNRSQVIPGTGRVLPEAMDRSNGPNAPQVEVPEGGYENSHETITFNQLAQQLVIDPLVLTNFLLDHRATVNGTVRGPGSYLVGPDATLSDLLATAGGTGSWADTSSVELITTSLDPNSGRSLTQLNHLPLNSGLLASYIVQPHDEFRFNEVFNDANLGTVKIEGEVRFAGSYKLTRGERLSDLLSRAGGLTAAAYPYGTIFLRKSAALKEREGYVRAANEAQDQLLVAMTRVGSNKLDPSVFTAMQGFISDLRAQQPLGRVAIQADPSVLAANPALDPLLEEDDVLYIPPRPSTISVAGQVMQPGSFPYRPGASLQDYLEQAGGYDRYADEGDTFVVFPDGSARKIETSWLRFGATTNLPPGSSIVVPRDIAPLDIRQTVIDITQILSQLAVSAASLAVLAKQ